MLKIFVFLESHAKINTYLFQKYPFCTYNNDLKMFIKIITKGKQKTKEE